MRRPTTCWNPGIVLHSEHLEQDQGLPRLLNHHLRLLHRHLNQHRIQQLVGKQLGRHVFSRYRHSVSCESPTFVQGYTATQEPRETATHGEKPGDQLPEEPWIVLRRELKDPSHPCVAAEEIEKDLLEHAVELLVRELLA